MRTEKVKCLKCMNILEVKQGYDSCGCPNNAFYEKNENSYKIGGKDLSFIEIYDILKEKWLNADRQV